MSPSSVLSPEMISETGLPTRDFIILPLLSLLTIVLCLLACEAITSHFFAQQVIDSCQVPDNRIGHRYRPDCTAHLKTAEGPWTTNEYNECGYRGQESCGPKPPGTTRIAILGDSVSLGEYVPYDQTFAQELARGLTQILGRRIEVQNLSRTDAEPVSMAYQVDEALALKPDLLLIAIDPYDIEHLRLGEVNKPTPTIDESADFIPVHGTGTPLKRVESLMKESSTATAAAHFLFQNSATYARIYMHHGDHADYLRRPLSLAWQQRLEALDSLLARMAAKSDAQHVPLVLVLTPSLAQAALVRGTLPTGVDPFLLSTALQQIASRHGIQFIGTLEDFRQGEDPSKAFYVVDTHLNAEGQEIVSRVLIRDLMKEQRSALLGLHESQTQYPAGQ